MPARLIPEPPGLPLLLTRAQSHAAGISDDRIRRLVQSGRWVAMERGEYLRQWAVNDPVDPHVAGRHMHRRHAIIAARRRAGSVIGYASAAVVLGLPLVSNTPAQVQLLVPPGAWSGIRGRVRSRQSRWLEEDVMVVNAGDGDSVCTTTVARTWVDVARTAPLADALSVGDAALRRGEMTTAQASAVLERMGRVRGFRQAERALTLLDPLRESPLESGSAARFIEWRFPPPRLQHTFYDEWGAIARSDFDWPDFEVIGFADGLMKYALDPQRDRSERYQESRLRSQGVVVRWGWSEMTGGIGLYRLLAPLLRVPGPMPQLVRL